jgi:hypothetical protein
MVIRTEKAVRYPHLELGKDVDLGIAGYYTPEKEIRLEYNGREVLVIIGKAVVEASCCGTGNWVYAVIPGYIVRWHSGTTKNGTPESEVEPIIDAQAREDIKKTIETSENAVLVTFW